MSELDKSVQQKHLWTKQRTEFLFEKPGTQISVEHMNSDKARYSLVFLNYTKHSAMAKAVVLVAHEKWLVYTPNNAPQIIECFVHE